MSGVEAPRGFGPARPVSARRPALGVLWLADALVKILIPFGGRAADQAYEQIMSAMSGPPGLHRLLARETNVFAAHPFLWWLPASVELCLGGWLLARPASRRALAVSAAWAVIVWVAGEGMGGLFGGASSVLMGYPGAALLYVLAAAVLFPARRPRDEAAAAAEAGVLGLYWSRLAWLQARGRAHALPEGPETDRARAALRDKYPQYQSTPLQGPVIRIDVEEWVGWDANTADN